MKILATIFLFLFATPPIFAATPPGIDWSKESIFLFGFKSNVNNVVVFAYSGKIRDGKFHLSMFTPARMNTPANQGYTIGISKGKETIGISEISWYPSGAIYTVGFPIDFCQWRPSPVFTTKPGQIIYVTDINFDARRSADDRTEVQFSISFDFNIEAARAWVLENYPEQISRFVVADIYQLPIPRKCKMPANGP